MPQRASVRWNETNQRWMAWVRFPDGTRRKVERVEKAQADFRTAVSKIDKAGIRRVLHPNTAARRKSKLARDFQAALAKPKG